MHRNISVINPGFGNIGALQNAFRYLGYKVEVTEALRPGFDAVVLLPGVGSFAAMADFSARTGLRSSLESCRNAGGVVIGICLGMQFLFAGSDEGAGDGLGFLTGRVKNIHHSVADARVPSMGWKAVMLTEPGQQALGAYVASGERYYFTHSYCVCDPDPQEVFGVYSIGSFEVPAIVGGSGVLGFQFHPEKSNRVGLDLLAAVLMNYGI